MEPITVPKYMNWSEIDTIPVRYQDLRLVAHLTSHMIPYTVTIASSLSGYMPTLKQTTQKFPFICLWFECSLSFIISIIICLRPHLLNAYLGKCLSTKFNTITNLPGKILVHKNCTVRHNLPDKC